jgi:hypothetical protein
MTHRWVPSDAVPAGMILVATGPVVASPVSAASWARPNRWAGSKSLPRLRPRTMATTASVRRYPLEPAEQGPGLPGRHGRMPTVAGQKQRAPRVLKIAWGRMTVEGLGTGKDIKPYPGGGRTWDWAEPGTRHRPGIQPADVEELLAHGATAVVLSRGMAGQLQVNPATRDYLNQRGIAVHVAETREAVTICNELAERGLAAGLFHSTC